MNNRPFTRLGIYLSVVVAVSLLFAHFSRGHAKLPYWPFGALFGVVSLDRFIEFIHPSGSRVVKRFTTFFDSLVCGYFAATLLALTFDAPVADRLGWPVLFIVMASRGIYGLVESRFAKRRSAIENLQSHLITKGEKKP